MDVNRGEGLDGEHARPGIVWFPNPLSAGSQMKSDGDPVYISPRVDYFKCISEDVQNCGGGDREIFERRSKVLDSYQDLRVHHTSLPPDLHPFQVIIT